MFVFAIFMICCSSALADVVKLPYGQIRGFKEKSRNDNDYYAFRGIKYAEAERFEDPKEPKEWKDIQEAKKFGNVCPHEKPLRPGEVTGNEDCLYLNVYTQSLDQSTKAAVLFWIHGGAFSFGSSMLYGPEYLMDKPVVLVTINYRLNVLGFIHLHDELLPGNYGMKDQVEALKWVQKYIYLFGGDAERVTLAGSSAGAASVHWHMYSEMSRGLFHQAICESGTAKTIWAEIPKDLAKSRANSIATIAGCDYADTKVVIECLRKISVNELVRIQKVFELWRGTPFHFGVVVETKASKNPFVTVSPWSSEALPHEVPLIIGFTSNEGGFIVPGSGMLKNQGEALNELGANYQRLFPIINHYQFNVGLKPDAIDETTEKIRSFYFGEKQINKDSFEEIKQMLSDSQFIYYTMKTIQTYSATIYAYKYSHQNKHTFAELEENFLKPGGPVHSDDLISLFKLMKLSKDPLEEGDLIVSELMIDLWTNFIIKGDPNINDNYDVPIWTPYKQNSEFYNINTVPTIEKFDRTESYEFWNNLGWHRG